ncbi:MAG: hypothetical protein V4674_02580 [Patescibacteria group bacterium]
MKKLENLKVAGEFAVNDKESDPKVYWKEIRHIERGPNGDITERSAALTVLILTRSKDLILKLSSIHPLDLATLVDRLVDGQSRVEVLTLTWVERATTHCESLLASVVRLEHHRYEVHLS